MAMFTRWRNALRRKLNLAQEIQTARDSGVLKRFGNTLPLELNERYMDYWRSCVGAPVSRPEILNSANPVMLVRGAIARDTALCLSEKFTKAARERSQLPAWRRLKRAIVEWTRSYATLPNPLSTFGDLPLAPFDGELGRVLRQQYGCEFTILWCDCYRAKVGRPGASWLWHFDNVPLPALKVLLYLSDTEHSGATTRVLDFATSQAIKDRGYLGLTGGDRTGDLKPLADEWGIPLEVHAPKMHAGDALVFHTNCFHQAVTPIQGFRDAMTFFVLPAPTPWRRGGDFLQLEKRPGGFPPRPELIPSWGAQL